MKKLLCFLFCFYIFNLPSNALDEDTHEISGTMVRFATKEVVVPANFEVETHPGNVRVIYRELADFYFYPSIEIAGTMPEYTAVRKLGKIDPGHLDHYVGGIYGAIRALGKDKGQQEEAEQLVLLIQRIVTGFPANELNSYKFVRSEDRKSFRICMEGDDKVILVLVPGSKKPLHKDVRIDVEEVTNDTVSSQSYRFLPSIFYNAAKYFYSARLFQMFYHPVSQCRLFIYLRTFFYNNNN